MNFLYWNVNKKNLASYIADACIENESDVIILTEHEYIDTNFLIRRLKEFSKDFDIERVDPESRILLLHSTKAKVNIIEETEYYSVFKITSKNDIILLFAVHLPSQYRQDRNDLNMFAGKISSEFDKLEERLKIYKSIVVGDFNLNPFDDGMVSVWGFNAVMCPDIARKETRTYLYEKKKFYYNPMWHLMGNTLNITKGTYYYSSDAKSYFWYTFDQVLIRPELLSNFNVEDLKIINSIYDNSLLTDSKQPNQRAISDHLPIKYKIELEE